MTGEDRKVELDHLFQVADGAVHEKAGHALELRCERGHAAPGRGFRACAVDDDDVSFARSIDHRADPKIVRREVAMLTDEFLHGDGRTGEAEARCYGLDMDDDVVVEAARVERVCKRARRELARTINEGV